MNMYQDRVEVQIIPDVACCTADEDRRNPLYIDECPYGYDECSGDCEHYKEEWGE